MSKGQFSNRYTIEYLHPGTAGSKEESSGKKGLFVAMLVLAGLVASGGYLWTQGYFKPFLTGNQVAEPEEVNTSTENIEPVADNKPEKREILNEKKPKIVFKNSKEPVVKPVVAVAGTHVKKSFGIDKTGEEIFLDKCSYCHGKHGEGNLKDTYPKLQGQHAAYLLRQLIRMRDGRRLNVNPAMFKIIKKMDDKTLERIAIYISKIPSPKGRLEKEQERILADKLQALNDQLLIEKKKNSQLEKQLKRNLEISSNLSKLYDDAVKDVEKNDNDKNFMKVVQREKQRIIEATKSSSKGRQSRQETVVSETVANTTVAQNAASTNLNSNVEVSTTGQMDKILSAMKNTDNRSLSASNSKKASIEDKPKVVQMTVGLQSEINQLVSSQNIPKTSFTKALKSEEKVRKNSVRSVVVKKGETLWSIAKRAYGSGFEYPKILKANPGLKKGKVVRLYIGQVIRVPR